MSIFNDKALKSVAEAAAKVMQQEELKGNQHKIDANKNGKIDAHDFKLLRGKKDMKKEEVEQLDEVGDTPAGRKALGSYVNKAIADKTKDRAKGLRKATSRMYKDNFYGKKNEEVEINEGDVYDKDRYAVKDGKATKDNPSHMGSANYKDQSHHVWATSAEHAVRKHAAKTAKPVKEDVQQLDEIGDTPAGQKRLLATGRRSFLHAGTKKGGKANVSDLGQKTMDRVEKRLSDKSKNTRLFHTKIKNPQAHPSDRPGLVSRAVDAVKKAFTREEVEAIFNDFTLDEIQTFMMSEEFANLHVESQEQIDSYLEDRLLDEGFPSVEDAKKRMAAGKTQHGSVTKTATGLVHKRDYKDDNDDEDDAPKKKSGYGARQNYKRSTRVNEGASFTEMLELYNEHGLKVLAPIETEEMDIDGTTIEVIDGDKINGFVETMVEEPDNALFTKELKDQEASAAGKKPQPKVAAGKTMGVKTMPEEVELDERSLTPDEKSEMEKNVKGMKKKLSGFKERYGERAKSVIYATATKMAKKD